MKNDSLCRSFWRMLPPLAKGENCGVKETVAVLFFNFALRFHYFTFILCSLCEASVPLIQNPHHCYSPVLSTGIDSKECFQSVWRSPGKLRLFSHRKNFLSIWHFIFTFGFWRKQETAAACKLFIKSCRRRQKKLYRKWLEASQLVTILA